MENFYQMMNVILIMKKQQNNNYIMDYQLKMLKNLSNMDIIYRKIMMEVLINWKMKMNNYLLIIIKFKCINYKHLNNFIQNNNKLINYINNKLKIYNYYYKM